MKKLLLVSLLSTSIAFAQNSTLTEIKEDAKDVGLQFASVVVDPAVAIKDVTVSAAKKTAQATKDGFNQAKGVARDAATAIADSDAGDVCGQLFIDAPCEVAYNASEMAKKAAAASVAALKEAKDKVANSAVAEGAGEIRDQLREAGQDVAQAAIDAAAKVVAGAKIGAIKVKDASVAAANLTVDATKQAGSAVKDAAVYVKDAAVYVKDSEVGQETADVLGQLASAPAAVWEEITDLSSTIKEKIVG